MRLIGLVLALTLAPLAAEAQEAGKVYRIGWLSPGTGPSPRTQSFLEGLRDRGYVEGQHFVMEWRRADGRSERKTDRRFAAYTTGPRKVIRPALEWFMDFAM
jgi:hypothetical protein